MALFRLHSHTLFHLVLQLSMYNRERNRGLAFITMASEEEAITALNSLNTYVSSTSMSNSNLLLFFFLGEAVLMFIFFFGVTIE